ILDQQEGEILEFKAVLPPSGSIGKILCAFANAKGGHLVLGVAENNGSPNIVGLSNDFNADSVTRKAVDLLSPPPVVFHQYVQYGGKRLYVIKVEASGDQVSSKGRVFLRVDDRVVEVEATPKTAFREAGFEGVKELSIRLNGYSNGTGAKSKFVEHFQSVLKIIDDLETLLYPNSPTTPATSREGKILARILFSSSADTFESYVSDVLYEIYLANPNTLKSNEQVTVEDVLNCNDIEEFVDVWARRKLGKLQRGSVKGFIADNKQMKELNAVNASQQDDIERILQVRHLYSHRNGIVDEKFLKYYPGEFELNKEHAMSVATMLEKLAYLADTVDRIDAAAIAKYSLAAIN
ncbi:MAG TPA: ATP-binding protein, partial [Planctomycetaceae bacterium]|nr:ATP-binding protein [Planctomycetaceae bacterium]